MFDAGACRRGGVQEGPVGDRQERRMNQGLVEEPEPPEPLRVEDRTPRLLLIHEGPLPTFVRLDLPGGP